MPALQNPLIDTLNAVGVEKIFARDAAEAPTVDGATLLPWTLPLHRSEAVALLFGNPGGLSMGASAWEQDCVDGEASG